MSPARHTQSSSCLRFAGLSDGLLFVAGHRLRRDESLGIAAGDGGDGLQSDFIAVGDGMYDGVGGSGVVRGESCFMARSRGDGERNGDRYVKTEALLLSTHGVSQRRRIEYTRSQRSRSGSTRRGRAAGEQVNPLTRRTASLVASPAALVGRRRRRLSQQRPLPSLCLWQWLQPPPSRLQSPAAAPPAQGRVPS